MPTPQLDLTSIPAADQDRARDIEILLGGLDKFVTRFEHALLLIERNKREFNDSDSTFRAQRLEAKGRPDYLDVFPSLMKEHMTTGQVLLSWSKIAERDMALTIWDFSTTMYNIRKALDACPSVNALVPRPKLEKVLANLSAAFPDRKKMRHAAAHPADLKGTANQQARNSIGGEFEGGGIKISENASVFMSGNSGPDGTVISSYLGEVVSFKADASTLTALDDLKAQMFACFPNSEPSPLNNPLGDLRVGYTGRRRETVHNAFFDRNFREDEP
jgi:hypothetical protein